MDSRGASQVVLVVKNLPANAEDIRDEKQVWSLGWEDPLGEGTDNPLQCSCLGNPMDREAYWATVYGGHKESDMTKVT